MKQAKQEQAQAKEQAQAIKREQAQARLKAQAIKAQEQEQRKQATEQRKAQAQARKQAREQARDNKARLKAQEQALQQAQERRLRLLSLRQYRLVHKAGQRKAYHVKDSEQAQAFKRKARQDRLFTSRRRINRRRRRLYNSAVKQQQAQAGQRRRRQVRVYLLKQQARQGIKYHAGAGYSLFVLGKKIALSALNTMLRKAGNVKYILQLRNDVIYLNYDGQDIIQTACLSLQQSIATNTIAQVAILACYKAVHGYIYKQRKGAGMIKGAVLRHYDKAGNEQQERLSILETRTGIDNYTDILYTRQILQGMKRKLSERDYTILLYRLAGMNQQAIAGKLSITQQAISKAQDRIRVAYIAYVFKE